MNKLRAFRALRGLTGEAMGKKLDMSKQVYLRKERESDWTNKEMKKFREVFNLTVSELIELFF